MMTTMMLVVMIIIINLQQSAHGLFLPEMFVANIMISQKKVTVEQNDKFVLVITWFQVQFGKNKQED